MPPNPAAAVSVTVPFPDWPLVIVAGFTVMPLSAAGAGFTVTPNVLLTPDREAVRVTGVDVLILPAVTVNVCEVAPCGTVTDPGTLAAVELELESDTATPPMPVAADKVTVPVPGWPMEIVEGLTEIPLRAGGVGLTVRPNVALTPE
jgi:hypothetical protein